MVEIDVIAEPVRTSGANLELFARRQHWWPPSSLRRHRVRGPADSVRRPLCQGDRELPVWDSPANAVVTKDIRQAVIDLFCLDALTNEVRGWGSLQLGRMLLSELTVYYAADAGHG